MDAQNTFLYLPTLRVQAVPCICNLWLRPVRFQTLLSEAAIPSSASTLGEQYWVPVFLRAQH